MKKKVIALLLAATFALTCFAGCNGKGGGAAGGSGSTIGSKDDVYYMVTYLSTLEFWNECYQGFRKGAEQWGAHTEYVGAEGVDAAAQLQVLDQVIATKPAGIAITVCDATALNDSINRAIDEGIEVVCFDAGAEGSKAYSDLATGNESAGAALADVAAEKLGGKGECAVIFSTGSPTHEARARGIKNELESLGYTCHEANFDGEQTDGASQASSLIAANPNLKAIFVVNANGALGAASAVREAGKEGDILVIGFDTDGGMYEAIDEGSIYATAYQGTFNMGYWAFQFLFAVKNNLVNPVNGWREAGLSPLPPQVDTGVNIITKDNLSTFYKK